ncbi:MAG: hypothetical protein FWG20_06690 [Candidatus Cloacimonetes bacterium]|nr:hypothetical protein [Candidatus Cloacimonadota bacterium]
MTIEVKDIITLNDDKKYVVCSRTDYQDNYYLYLIDINDNTNVKFAMEKVQGERITIIEIENEELIQTLIPLLFNEAKDTLRELEEQ